MAEPMCHALKEHEPWSADTWQAQAQLDPSPD